MLGWRGWRKELEDKGKGYIFNVFKWKIHPRGQGGHPKRENQVPRTLLPVIFIGQGRELPFSKEAWLLEMKVINTFSKYTVRKYVSLCFFGWALWSSQSGSGWPGTENTAELGTNSCIHFALSYVAWVKPCHWLAFIWQFVASHWWVFITHWSYKEPRDFLL